MSQLRVKSITDLPPGIQARMRGQVGAGNAATRTPGLLGAGREEAREVGQGHSGRIDSGRSDSGEIGMMLPYPVSANRYWRTGVIKGVARTYVSAEARAFKSVVGFRAKAAGMLAPLSGAVKIRLTLHPKITKKGVASLVRLDLSNSIKVCEDALNGIAYLDDDQVVSINAKVGEPVLNGGLFISVKAA